MPLKSTFQAHGSRNRREQLTDGAFTVRMDFGGFGEFGEYNKWNKINVKQMLLFSIYFIFTSLIIYFLVCVSCSGRGQRGRRSSVHGTVWDSALRQIFSSSRQFEGNHSRPTWNCAAQDRPSGLYYSLMPNSHRPVRPYSTKVFCRVG